MKKEYEIGDIVETNLTSIPVYKDRYGVIVEIHKTINGISYKAIFNCESEYEIFDKNIIGWYGNCRDKLNDIFRIMQERNDLCDIISRRIGEIWQEREDRYS